MASFSFFPFSSQNPFFFPQPTKPVSEKRRSRTRSPLDRREIWVSCLQHNSEHSHRWEFRYHVWNERKTLRIVAFFFPAEIQSCLGKTTIPVSLTVGLLWNLDMLFEIQLRTFPPLGYARKYSWREKMESHEDNTSGGFNLRLSDVWEFYQSSRKNNWRNLRKPLEMLLSLAEDTWVRLEVRDELFTVGD